VACVGVQKEHDAIEQASFNQDWLVSLAG